MTCPECGSRRSAVTDTRYKEGKFGIWRRRECLTCGHRFSTMERVDPDKIDPPRKAA